MNPDPEVKSDPRRRLPPVSQVSGQVREMAPDLPSWAATEGARRALAAAREALGAAAEDGGDAASEAPQAEAGPAALGRAALRHARALCRPHPGRVVNATGIVLHTNLGRAPLGAGAVAALADVAGGYADLELDLETGARGQRTTAVVEKLRLLTGAADALAVNNNAAAMLLVLASMAISRDVIVSRGELVEIGGSFRVPEILAAAGVRLVEVGTTNRTHPRDYESAITDRTALLLKVHRSNFTQSGFVREVSLRELSAIGRRHGLPVVEDLGSGLLLDLTARGFPAESHAPSRLREGADVVCFSGDKLLGGPQAGIVLSASPEPVAAMRRNPLARALRLDKLALAALDWTLAVHLEGRAETEIPVLRQLLAPIGSLEARARGLADRLRAAGVGPVAVEPDRAYAGGGSLPDLPLEGFVVAVRAPKPSRLADRLRGGAPPVLARVRDDALVLDPRTLEPDEEAVVVDALRALLVAPASALD